MTAEAAVLLLEASLTATIAPTAIYARLGRATSIDDNDGEQGAGGGKVARRIRRALAVAERAFPWTSTCLVKAIAAKKMLERRGVRCRLCLGVVKTENSGLKAHAWVLSEGIHVVGGDHVLDFVEVAKFK
jgi:Transglutaminase-like superfamily